MAALQPDPNLLRPAPDGGRVREGGRRPVPRSHYKGSPSAFTDLLAGRVDLFFDSIAAALPYIQSDR